MPIIKLHIVVFFTPNHVWLKNILSLGQKWISFLATISNLLVWELAFFNLDVNQLVFFTLPRYLNGKERLFSDVSSVKFNPLKPELNPICYLLALLAHHFLHVSRIRVKSLTIRLLMSYIYGAPVLDVSRSHTTTQHSR